MLTLFALVGAIALYVSVKDSKEQIISDRTNSILIFVALIGTGVLALSANQYKSFLVAWLTGLGTFSFLYFLAIISRGAIGGGDIKFAPSLATVLAFENPTLSLWMLLAAFQVAGLVALWGIFSKKLSLKAKIAFAPYLTIGYFLVAIWNLALV